MNKSLSYYEEILSAYIAGSLPASQLEKLFAFIRSDEAAYAGLLESPGIQRQLEQLTAEERVSLHQAISDRMKARLMGAIQEGQQESHVKHKGAIYHIRPYWKVAAAACLVIVAALGYLLTQNKRDREPAVQVQTDVKAPAVNKAAIILPNGREVVLDTVANGTLIAGVIRKTADGELKIEGSSSVVAYLTAHNPRNSRVLHIELPDHTRVWLNAETDLRYPTAFNGNERLVNLIGEAFFEVTHNAKQPFRVKAGDQLVEDIGTSFNVKAYSQDNAVATTLVEGIVKINGKTTLKPGEQFLKERVTKANTDEVLAWKSGSFYLDQSELGAVASELARWYDVEIVFVNPALQHNVVFGGEIGRDLSLAQVIRVLEKLGVHARLENRQLMIE